MTAPATQTMLTTLWAALKGADTALDHFRETGAGSLPSCFAVSDLASASIGVAGLALREWLSLHAAKAPPIEVDRRLASLWFAGSVTPIGWQLPPAWDAIAGDYQTTDGWIRLHTNARHHRDAALAVLGVAAERALVEDAIKRWSADALEAAVVNAGGCAARMRSQADWLLHPQGQAVMGEPLIWHEQTEQAEAHALPITPARPLQGIRVLDLTRVLAGPTATRFLAGFGADVLRLDPVFWEEPSLEAEMTLGKHCARIDLSTARGRDQFKTLLAEADICVSGYRSDALERLGLGASQRQIIRPGLIDVSLNAYGWSGPWAARRGFDSLVQMSTGIAAEGMAAFGTQQPKPLPVQALDYAVGYLLAAAALRGLSERQKTGRGSRWRTSLARMACLLMAHPQTMDGQTPFAPKTEDDDRAAPEHTAWGEAKRLRSALTIEGAPMAWDVTAGPIGRHQAQWREHNIVN
ncbi:CoA transferase [Rhizobium oryziradicis]|uniref:Acyl-CoA transferase n=1 Tax=Rhizobium oryziradicis TaxID=1867956 RepID=A0A1Q8ZTM6_9HYPH|nr:CoA transferase [Rhizobium oryziradicis]OLP45354.1 acyl-CoA transferase [Rhizobium oryziradicis]